MSQDRQGGLQQGGLAATGAGPPGIQEETREVSLIAVRDDVINMSDSLQTLDSTVQRLQAHLMGEQPSIKGGELERTDKPSPTGELPSLCNLGANNLRYLHQIQERLNQLCYQLGEGR